MYGSCIIRQTDSAHKIYGEILFDRPLCALRVMRAKRQPGDSYYVVYFCIIFARKVAKQNEYLCK